MTDAYLHRIARGAGVDVGRAFEDARGEAVVGQLDAAARQAQRFNVDSTPSFFLARAGAQPHRLSPTALSVDQFARPIEAALQAP